MSSEAMVWAVGILAGTCTTLSWIPQAVRTIRRRSADDFSWTWLSVFATGIVLWTVYGFARRDPVLITANVVTLLLLVPVLGIKLSAVRMPPSGPPTIPPR